MLSGVFAILEPSPYDGVVIAPVGADSSQYGVRVCQNMVHAPYYTSGCTISYPLNNPESNMCRMECPTGLETVINGAESSADCLPTDMSYEDSTGTFRLGSNPALCN